MENQNPSIQNRSKLAQKKSGIFSDSSRGRDQICKRKHVDPPQAMGIHFQEEIIMDILSKLPVRTLLRFNCVSKFWKTLICDPYFKMKHLNYAKNDQNSHKFLIRRKNLKDRECGLFYSCPLSPVQLMEEDAQKLDCSLNSRPLLGRMLCSCDGLFILNASDGFKAVFVLWNPSTRESVALPYPEFTVRNNMFSCMWGLAYDAASDDYKILKLDVSMVDPKVSSEILALKSGSWKRIGKPSMNVIPVSSFAIKECLAFVHGAFHRIGFELHSSYAIVSFNISNEVYGEIPLLERMFVYDMLHLEYDLSVLGGLLCFYSTGSVQGEGTFKLWIMKDYGVKESWTNLYTIRDSALYSARPKYRFADGEVLVRFRHETRSSLGPIYRTSKGSSYFGLLLQCDPFHEGFAYTESLIFPKLIT